MPRQSANSGTARGDKLMDLIVLTHGDQDRGVTKGTHEKTATSSKKWKEFTTAHNLDLHLRGKDQQERIDIFGAYAYAYTRRHPQNGKGNGDVPRGRTIRAEINAISATFRSLGFQDPIRDTQGNIYIKLNRQLKGYEATDPPPQRQSPLPLKVFKEVFDSARTERNIAIRDLITGALSLGARSCEYTHTPRLKDKKTVPLSVGDFTFFDRHNCSIDHRNPNCFKGCESPSRIRRMGTPTTPSLWESPIISYAEQKHGHAQCKDYGLTLELRQKQKYILSCAQTSGKSSSLRTRW